MMTTNEPNYPQGGRLASRFRDLSTARARRLVLAASAMACLASSASAADDSVWINSGIRAAISQGKSEYILPAGRFNLSHSIVIPDGTRNFTLRGRGRDLTTFRADTTIDYAVFAGIQTIMWNNYGVTNLTNYTANPAVEGDSTLKLSSVAGIKAGDYLAIYDEGYVKHYANGDAQRNHSAIIKVVSVNAGAKSVVIDRPLGRDYILSPRVALINEKIVTGLAIKDMGFDGTIAGLTARNNGIVSLGVSDKVSLSNLTVTHFSTRALTMNWARDVSIDGVSILDGANAGAPGNAYGVTICRSQNVLVKNCVSTETRHSYLVTNGSTDVTFQDCIAGGDNGNFDTHGFDERRITYLRCRATGTLNLGNDAYLGGGSDYLIKDSSFLYSVLLYSNVKKVRAQNSTFWGISVNSRFNTAGWPTGGMPDDIVFTDCNFIYPKAAMYADCGDFGNLTFDHCTFQTNAGEPYALLMQNQWAGGNLTLQSCKVIMRCTGNYVPITLLTARPTFTFTMKDCEVYTTGNAWAAVVFGPAFGGRGVVTGNTIYTDQKLAHFGSNTSRSLVDDRNNSVKMKAAGAALLNPNILKP